MNNKISGGEAESLFVQKINECADLRTCYVDAHYDFDVWDDVTKEKIARVEVKSCHLFHKDGNGRFKIGRFDFTNKESFDKMKQENVFVCFILFTTETDKVILGFAPATAIQQKRYINFSQIPNLKPITFEQFIKTIRGTQCQPQVA